MALKPIEIRKAQPVGLVHDLASQAGSFSEVQSPSCIGWMRIESTRRLDRRMFVARVVGHSMEPGVPDGSWCLFRAFAAGEASAAMSLDGRRVVVQRRDDVDPELGGHYTLKRWKVSHVLPGGTVDEIELRPDNPPSSRGICVRPMERFA